MKIINNTVGGNGIIIDGSKDSADNLIKDNRTQGPCTAKSGRYVITNQANAKVENNSGFDGVDAAPWRSKKERDDEQKAKKTKK